MSLNLEEIHIFVSVISILFLGLMGYLGLFIKDKVVNSVTALELRIMNSLGEIRETQVEIKGEVQGHIKEDNVIHESHDRRIERLEGNRH